MICFEKSDILHVLTYLSTCSDFVFHILTIRLIHQLSVGGAEDEIEKEKKNCVVSGMDGSNRPTHPTSRSPRDQKHSSTICF